LELDLVALHEGSGEILFAECKWKDNVNADKVLQGLKRKSGYVQWNNETRREHYAIFARSFGRRSTGALCYDIEDIKRSTI
jgi:AAA+ ATPase superfamily predicted ATPase